MSVGFHKFSSEDICGICLESMVGGDVVAHDGSGGDKHPWHLTCIQEWLRISDKFPSNCKVTLDKHDKIFWQHKTIKELATDSAMPLQEELQKMVRMGVFMGGMMGTKYVSSNPLGVETILAPIGWAALGGGVVAVAEGAVLAVQACLSLQIANFNRISSDDESFEDILLI